MVAIIRTTSLSYQNMANSLFTQITEEVWSTSVSQEMWVLFLAVLQTYRVFLNKSLTPSHLSKKKKKKIQRMHASSSIQTDPYLLISDACKCRHLSLKSWGLSFLDFSSSYPISLLGNVIHKRLLTSIIFMCNESTIKSPSPAKTHMHVSLHTFVVVQFTLIELFTLYNSRHINFCSIRNQLNGIDNV